MRNVDLLKTLSLVLLLMTACDSDDQPAPLELTIGNIETFAGMGPANFGYEGDNGPALSAKLGYLTGIAVDKTGNVYYTDGAANVVRKISVNSGNITTIAGTFLGFNKPNSTPFAGDGGNPMAAHLNVPLSISVDNAENVFIADAGNSAVREVSSSTGKISTVAGKGFGFAGYGGDGGLATQSTLWNPYSVAVDTIGNIYLADSQNNVIRMITKSTGTITTIAGLGPNNPGYSGDNGPATAAKLSNPQGVAVDGNGNIYISDSGNRVIRKISVGNITTIAGTGSEGYSGDDGPALSATFVSLKGLAVDESNIYVADGSNNVVRMIHASTGKIFTVAGNGTAGYSGMEVKQQTRRFQTPWALRWMVKAIYI